MRTQPDFSIIIPIYNVENYLRQCLNSICAQTFENLEIICINDGSNDLSRNILNQYQKADKRFIVIDIPNGGPSAARNIGLAIARGNYIIFMDSDDFVEKDLCFYLHDQLAESNPDILVYGAFPFPENTSEISAWLSKNLAVNTVVYKNNSIQALLHENGAFPFVWRNCFKRSFLSNSHLQFVSTVRFGEDLIFQFMAFPMASHILFLDRRLYHYRWKRPSSAMFNAQMDLYGKYLSHIHSIKIIAKYWEEHGLLVQNQGEFFKWTVSFVGTDLYHYSGQDKMSLIREIRDFWKSHHMDMCKGVLTDRQQFYYSYIWNYDSK